jgi:hypothetical protein
MIDSPSQDVYCKLPIKFHIYISDNGLKHKRACQLLLTLEHVSGKSGEKSSGALIGLDFQISDKFVKV